jgi:hypothetical protein
MRTNNKYLLFFVLILFLISGVVGKEVDFELEVGLIKSSVEPGSSASDEIVINNLGDSQTFFVEYNEDFISIEDEELTLGEGETGSFEVFLDSLDYDLGVYLGEIVVVGESEEIIVPVILEVQTPFPLFDVSVEVPPGFVTAVSGGEFIVDVNVYKLKGETDEVELNYYVSDTKGNVIFSEIQNLNVDKQARVTKTIPIPSEAVGNYVFFVSVTDGDEISTGTGSLLFLILPTLSPDRSVEKANFNSLIAFGVIVVLIVAFVLFNHYWNRSLVDNARNWNRKLVDIKKVKFSDTAREIRKLNRQKSALELAYGKGYIKRKSYDEGRKKINELIERLKKRL